ncbi:MAG TPA: efflux RND transporter permease subunit, partial [Phycisphaerae bacterium]|nr:efflux RND transporter permease subunit [Phycisphaerae bacterium]
MEAEARLTDLLRPEDTKSMAQARVALAKAALQIEKNQVAEIEEARKSGRASEIEVDRQRLRVVEAEARLTELLRPDDTKSIAQARVALAKGTLVIEKTQLAEVEEARKAGRASGIEVDRQRLRVVEAEARLTELLRPDDAKSVAQARVALAKGALVIEKKRLAEVEEARKAGRASGIDVDRQRQRLMEAEARLTELLRPDDTNSIAQARVALAKGALEIEQKLLAAQRQSVEAGRSSLAELARQELAVARAQMQLDEAMGKPAADTRKQFARRALEIEEKRLASLQLLHDAGRLPGIELDRQKLRVVRARQRLAEALGSRGTQPAPGGASTQPAAETRRTLREILAARPSPDISTIAERSEPNRTGPQTTEAFYDLLKLREGRDANAVPALQEILKGGHPRWRIHAYAAAQALFCIDTPGAHKALAGQLRGGRYPAKRGIDYAFSWQMPKPQRSRFIERYHLTDDSKGLAVELEANTLPREGRIDFTVTLRNVSAKAFHLANPKVYLGEMLCFRSADGRYVPSQRTAYPYDMAPKWVQLKPGEEFQHRISAQLRPGIGGKGDTRMPADAAVVLDTRDTRHRVGKPGRFDVFAMFESPVLTPEQSKTLKIDNAWSGRAVSKPVQVIILPGTLATTQSTTRSAESHPADETPAGSPFVKLTAKLDSNWLWNRTITIDGNGVCTYDLEELDVVPGQKHLQPIGNHYVAAHRVNPAHLRQLGGLLKETGWLTKQAGGSVADDAMVYQMSVVHEGREAKVVCHGGNEGPYKDLVLFLRRLDRQEWLLYQMAPGAKYSSAPIHQITGELDALLGKPSTIPPYAPVLDYQRLMPSIEKMSAEGTPAQRRQAAMAIEMSRKLAQQGPATQPATQPAGDMKAAAGTATEAVWAEPTGGMPGTEESARRRAALADLDEALAKASAEAGRLKLLSDAMRAEPASDVRRQMLSRANLLSDPAQEAWMLEILKDAPDCHLRGAAAVRLGKIGSRKAVEPLITAACHDKKTCGWMGCMRMEGTARRSAIFALAELAARLPKTQPRILKALRELPVKIDKADRESLGDARLQALYQLTGDAKLIQPFFQRLKDGDAEVRKRGVVAFRFLKLRKAPKELISRLTDSSADVRSWAALVLGEIGDPVAAESLMKAAADAGNTRGTRANAIVSLKRMRIDKAASLFEKLTRDSDEVVASHASAALQALKDTSPSTTQPATQPAQRPTFGHVIETVLHAPSPKVDHLLDLDGGRLVNRPEGFPGRDRAERRHWLAATEADLGYALSASNTPQLVRYGGEMVELDETWWDRPDSRALSARLAQAMRARGSASTWGATTAVSKGKVLGFRTRKATMGVLKVDAVLSNPHRVQLRFKLALQELAVAGARMHLDEAMGKAPADARKQLARQALEIEQRRLAALKLSVEAGRASTGELAEQELAVALAHMQLDEAMGKPPAETRKQFARRALEIEEKRLASLQLQHDAGRLPGIDLDRQKLRVVRAKQRLAEALRSRTTQPATQPEKVLAWRDKESDSLIGLSRQVLVNRFGGRPIFWNGEPIAKFSDKDSLLRSMPAGVRVPEVWGFQYKELRPGRSLVIRMWVGTGIAFDAYWCRAGEEGKAFFKAPPPRAATQPATRPSASRSGRIVKVTARIDGTSPADIEQSVALPLEDEVQGVRGVARCTTIASEGKVELYVVADRSADPNAFLVQIWDKVQVGAGRLPADAEVLSIVLMDANAAVPSVEVKQIDTIRVELDRDKMIALGITAGQATAVLRGLPATAEGMRRASDLPVASKSGKTVRLGDIARLRIAKGPSHIVRNDFARGRPAPNGASTQPAADAAEIERLIRQLGSDKFAEREEAQKELVKIGVPALEPLRAAAKDADAERAQRAKAAIAQICAFDLDDAAKKLTAAVGGTWRVRKPGLPGVGPSLSAGFSTWTNVAVPYIVLPFAMDEEGRSRLATFRTMNNAALDVVASDHRCTLLAGPSHEPKVTAEILRTLGLAESAEAKRLRLMRARGHWLDFRLAVAKPPAGQTAPPLRLTNGPTDEQIADYVSLLAQKGPNGGRHRGDPYQFFYLLRFCAAPAPLVTANDRPPGGGDYLLLSDKPGETLLCGPGPAKPWRLKRVYAAQDASGRPAVVMELDDAAGKRMGELTGANIGRPLAILFNGSVWSLLLIDAKMTDKVVLSGEGMTKDLAEKVVRSLSECMLLEAEPTTRPATQPAGTGARPNGASTQPAADANEIERLIRQLGSNKLAEREAATRELIAIGAPARAALEVAAESNDVERSQRAIQVLEEIRKRTARLGIYLVTEPEIGVEAEKKALADLGLAERPVLTDEEIEWYDANAHVFQVAEAGRKRLAHPRVRGVGEGFVVVADGNRVYLGAFTSLIASAIPS